MKNNGNANTTGDNNQDAPGTINWGYVAPNSRYLGLNPVQEPHNVICHGGVPVCNLPTMISVILLSGA